MLATFDLITAFVFTAEMMLKIIARGFWVGKDSYLRDPWCKLDFFLVVTSWAALMQYLPDFKVHHTHLAPLQPLVHNCTSHARLAVHCELYGFCGR